MVPIEQILMYGVHPACYSHCVFGNAYLKSLGLSDDELEDAIYKLAFSDGLNRVVERGLNKSIIDNYLEDWTEEMNAQHADHPRYVEIMKRMQCCHKRLLGKLPEAVSKYEHNLESKIADLKRKIYGQDAIDAEAETTVEVRKSSRIAQRKTDKNTPKKKATLSASKKKVSTLPALSDEFIRGEYLKFRQKHFPAELGGGNFANWKRNYILDQGHCEKVKAHSRHT